MSEAKYELQDVITVETFSTYNGDYSSSYGLLAGPKGDSLVFTHPSMPRHTHEFERNKLSRLCCLEILSYNSIDLLNGNAGDFYRAIGFDVIGESWKQNESITSISPLTSRLNVAINEFYSSESNPPFLFQEQPGSDAKFRGTDFIPALANGRLLISSILDPDNYEHDIIAHAAGYTAIDPKTHQLLKQKAEYLIEENKLQTDDDGYLVDYDAKHFMFRLDALSGILTSVLNRNRSRMQDILYDSVATVLDAMNLEGDTIKTVNRLKSHQNWLLQTAAN